MSKPPITELPMDEQLYSQIYYLMTALTMIENELKKSNRNGNEQGSILWEIIKNGIDSRINEYEATQKQQYLMESMRRLNEKSVSVPEVKPHYDWFVF